MACSAVIIKYWLYTTISSHFGLQIIQNVSLRFKKISKIYPAIELSIGLVWLIGATNFSQAIDIIYFSTIGTNISFP